MQLFHEMKQVFATVPDYLVCQHVADNCHDRAALIEHLRREAARQPATVQAYPQALRNQCHPLAAVSPPLSVCAPSDTSPPTAGHKPDDSAHRLPSIDATTSNHNHHPHPTARPTAEASSAMPMPARPHRPPPSPPAPAERRRFGLLRSAAAADAPIRTRYPCFDPRPIDPDNGVQSHRGHHRTPRAEPLAVAQTAQPPERNGDSSASAVRPKPFATQQTLDLR